MCAIIGELITSGKYFVRIKTYFSPEQQWDRTVALAMTCGFSNENIEYDGLGKSWHLGQIVQPHRSFRAGDLLIVRISNGQASRQPVWSVSSKGHVIVRHYLRFSTGSYDKPLGGKIYSIRVRDKQTRQVVTRRVKRRCHRPLKSGIFDSGPMRFVETPEQLAGLQPDAPPLRQFIVALAGEGWRKPDKRE